MSNFSISFAEQFDIKTYVNKLFNLYEEKLFEISTN